MVRSSAGNPGCATGTKPNENDRIIPPSDTVGMSEIPSPTHSMHQLTISKYVSFRLVGRLRSIGDKLPLDHEL